MSGFSVPMCPVTVHNAEGRGPLVLSCEHASCAVPAEYGNLGVSPRDLIDHVGWDIGAAELSRTLAKRLDSPAVLTNVSRLVIDCNRDLSDHDLIVATSHGIRIPGNEDLDRDERERRVREFYTPYHHTLDEVMEQHPQAYLLSVHSFTPALNGNPRRFDVGVLFDVFTEDADRVGRALAAQGLQVRYNEPYSGLDGLIYSARTHGQCHGARYLELEVNNRLLRDTSGIDQVAARLESALASWWGDSCDSF